ncbi:LysR family transcriptional regulator [Bordetella sp. N]|uniref:LysR family transcriptional regulator n=1 Tax=Bordetella sp. N TaxID=1746199 RepID=UPI000AE67CC0|nr:LysR family transcriptional regulator [Bordetella sp. N]
MSASLNDRWLRYFNEVYRSGTMRGAADTLGVEASVISRQIQQLEDHLGVKLFDRKGRGIAPTDVAAMLHDFCRERRASEENLLAAIADANAVQTGFVRVVVGEGFLDTVQRAVLDHFCRDYPGVDVHVDLAGAVEALRMIGEDEAHIGIGLNPPAHPSVTFVATCPQPLCVLAAPDHPLARARGEIRLSQVARHRIALMTEGFGLRKLVELAMFSEGVALPPAFTSNSIAMLKRYAAAGLGVTFMSTVAAADEIASGALVAKKAHNPIFKGATATLFTRRHRVLPPSARRLLDVLLSTAFPANGSRRGPP